jgi:hypothetical protein
LTVQVILSQQKLFNKEIKMHTIKEFMSGSVKTFELQPNSIATSVAEYRTKNNIHMMKAIVNGKITSGVYREKIFNKINSNLGKPFTFVFYNLGGNSRMICTVEKFWGIR